MISFSFQFAQKKFHAETVNTSCVKECENSDPNHSYIYTTSIGLGTVIYPNTHIDEDSALAKTVS